MAANDYEGCAFTAFLTNFPRNYDTPQKRRAKAQEIANSAMITCRYWERGDMIIVNPESRPLIEITEQVFTRPYGGWTNLDEDEEQE